VVSSSGLTELTKTKILSFRLFEEDSNSLQCLGPWDKSDKCVVEVICGDLYEPFYVLFRSVRLDLRR